MSLDSQTTFNIALLIGYIGSVTVNIIQAVRNPHKSDVSQLSDHIQKIKTVADAVSIKADTIQTQTDGHYSELINRITQFKAENEQLRERLINLALIVPASGERKIRATDLENNSKEQNEKE